MRVSRFVGCFDDTLFPDTGRAVDFPLDQACCGQTHNDSGYAAALMRRRVDVLAGAETVVCPSSPRVVTVRQACPLPARATGDAALLARAEALAERTFEFAEFSMSRRPSRTRARGRSDQSRLSAISAPRTSVPCERSVMV